MVSTFSEMENKEYYFIALITKINRIYHIERNDPRNATICTLTLNKITKANRFNLLQCNAFASI